MMVVVMMMAVVMMAVAMPMPMAMPVKNGNVGHKNDAALLMNMPVVVDMIADHFLVNVERLRRGREADGERQRGDRRKQ